MAMRVERAVLAEDDLAYLLWGKLGDGGPSPAGRFPIPGNLPCSFLLVDHSTDNGKHQAQPHHDAPSTETDALHTLTPYSVPKQIGSFVLVLVPSPWRCPVLRAIVK
ncbi:hypothetical protein CSPX01_03155 [Colletotrichum filicis]|nr:hypothetical protein CSPX01_03155 [Colletotrichum filicis]